MGSMPAHNAHLDPLRSTASAEPILIRLALDPLHAEQLVGVCLCSKTHTNTVGQCVSTRGSETLTTITVPPILLRQLLLVADR